MAGSCDAVVPGIKLKLEEQLVLNLYNSELRGNALVELSKKREMLPDLAPLMWHSFGTMIVLLQEIMSVYPALSPPTLSASVSNRACNVLALLQSVASHPETRIPFLKAEITEYLYPFLNTTSNARSFEYLRLTTLGVFGALVKVDDTEVVNTLLNGDIIPLCLRIMETGSELSKTVATFIVQKIIIDKAGLQYICATPECFFGIAVVLARMVADQPSTRLLKHIVRCYLRLTDDPRACIALQIHLPEALRDGTFDNGLRDDDVARRYLQQLLDNLAVPADGAPPPVPDPAAAGVTHPVPAPAAGSAPHPGPGPAAGASPGGSSQAGPSHAHPGPAPLAGAAPHPGPGHPGLGPVAGGSLGGSSPSSAHPGPAPTEVGAPHPGPGPVAGGRLGGSSQAGPRRRHR